MNNYWVDNKITGGWQEIQEKFGEFVKIENNIIYLLNTGIQIKIKYDNDKNFILSENNLQENIENKQPTEFNINWNEGYYLLNQSLLNLCFNTKKTKAEVIDDYNKIEDENFKIKLQDLYQLNKEDVFLTTLKNINIEKFLKKDEKFLSYPINFPSVPIKIVNIYGNNTRMLLPENSTVHSWQFKCEKTNEKESFPFKITINSIDENIYSLYKKTPYLFIALQSGGGKGSDVYDYGSQRYSCGGCGGGGGSFGIVLLCFDVDNSKIQFQITCSKNENGGEQLKITDFSKNIIFLGGENGKAEEVSDSELKKLNIINGCNKIINSYTPGIGGKIIEEKVNENRNQKMIKLSTLEGKPGIRSNRWVITDTGGSSLHYINNNTINKIEEVDYDKMLDNQIKFINPGIEINQILFYNQQKFWSSTGKTEPRYNRQDYKDNKEIVHNHRKDIACGGLGGCSILSRLSVLNGEAREQLYSGYGYGGDGNSLWQRYNFWAGRTYGSIESYKEGGSSCWSILNDDFENDYQDYLFEEEM